MMGRFQRTSLSCARRDGLGHKVVSPTCPSTQPRISGSGSKLRFHYEVRHKLIIVRLYGTLHPQKIKDVKEIRSFRDKYPCYVCEHSHRHQDLETGKWRACKFRINQCWREGGCIHFNRVGGTAREAREWRELNRMR